MKDQIELNYESAMIITDNDVYIEDTEGKQYIIFNNNSTKLYNYNNYNEFIRDLTPLELIQIDNYTSDLLPF